MLQDKRIIEALCNKIDTLEDIFKELKKETSPLFVLMNLLSSQRATEIAFDNNIQEGRDIAINIDKILDKVTFE